MICLFWYLSTLNRISSNLSSFCINSLLHSLLSCLFYLLYFISIVHFLCNESPRKKFSESHRSVSDYIEWGIHINWLKLDLYHQGIIYSRVHQLRIQITLNAISTKQTAARWPRHSEITTTTMNMQLKQCISFAYRQSGLCNTRYCRAHRRWHGDAKWRLLLGNARQWRSAHLCQNVLTSGWGGWASKALRMCYHFCGIGKAILPAGQ